MEKILPLYTTENIPGKSLELIGLVKGSMIQSKHIGRDIGSSLKSIVGGELRGYSEMLNEARAMATKRMLDEAEKLGADAVVCLRYTTSAVMQGAAEILVYGTAVRFR
ncbi:MAG: YbjQ family protein [Bacteroidales bacterium]